MRFLLKNKMLKSDFTARLSLLFFVSVLSFSSYGVKVYKVSVTGNQLIKSEMIKSQLRLKPNKHYNSYLARMDVKHLYSLGFFENIEVHSYKSNKGLHLVYKIKEKPIVAEIEFKGNKHIRKEDLEEIITVNKLDFLNYNNLYESFSAIKEKYKESGYFMVQISYQLSPIPKNKLSESLQKIKAKKIKLNISIQENKKILIKKINFIGNRNISSQKLQQFMSTKQKNILSFLGKSGVYNIENLNRDLQVIEYLYRNKGFLNVRLEKPEITFSADQKGIYISISILEGPRFKIGEVAFQGDKIVSEQDVKKHFSLKSGGYFSLSALQKDLSLVKDMYKEKSYAFAQASPQMFPDPSNQQVLHVLLTVQKGDSYKVDDVSIKGNHKTRDKVILRRLFLREGEPYKESKKKLTEQLLQRLGFFEQVNVVPIRKKEKGHLDILVDLKEREATGEANLAGGYNSYSRLFIKGGIKKNNFLGLDQSVSIDLSLSRYQEVFSFRYLNPYFLDTDWSLGIDVFNFGQDILSNQQSSAFDFNSQQDLSYSQLNTGFSFTFGRHLSQFLTSSLKYRLQRQSLGDSSIHFFRKIPGVAPVFNFIFGDPLSREELLGNESSFSDIYPLEEGEGLNSSLSGILEYDKRNDRYYASKGYYGRLSLEYSGLGGDFDYTKIEANGRHYYPVLWGMILKNNFNFGFVFPNKKGEIVPFTELFLLGGPYNLRGFQVNTVGPRKTSQKALAYVEAQGLDKNFASRPFGGKQMFYYNLELEIPLIPRAQLRGAVFIDIGEVNNKLSFDLESGLRADAGFGIRWRSPFGPINIDIGFPYKPKREYGENSMELQFGLGSSF